MQGFTKAVLTDSRKIEEGKKAIYFERIHCNLFEDGIGSKQGKVVLKTVYPATNARYFLIRKYTYRLEQL